MQKKISFRTVGRLFLVVGIVFLVLAAIGRVNISKLGLTPEEYTSRRDVYLRMVLGGTRYTSGSAINDLLMDSYLDFLGVGIFVAVAGAGLMFYYTKHPEKDKGLVITNKAAATIIQKASDLKSQGVQQTQSTWQTQVAQQTLNALPQQSKAAVQNLISTKDVSGPQRIAVLLAIAATACFTLGITIFPYALLSILSGVCLIRGLKKKTSALTKWMLIPTIAFMARFFLSEASYSGYDWVTVLYRVLGYITILIQIVMADFFVIPFLPEIEEDDQRLFVRGLMVVGIATSLLAVIELFRGLSYGFGVFMFRLGSIPFWFAFTMFYFYAQKPPVRTKADIYAGRQPHPYHNICGSVRTFMIVIYVLAAICFIAAPVGISAALDMLRGTASAGIFGFMAASALMGLVMYLMIIVCAIAFVTGLFLLWFNRKLRMRSPYFLLIYEDGCFALIVGCLCTVFFGGTSMLIGIALTIAALAISFLTVRWLCTSVQIRTYMGSDQYLREALFTKKFKSPIPADLPITGSEQVAAAVQQQNYPPVSNTSYTVQQQRYTRAATTPLNSPPANNTSYLSQYQNYASPTAQHNEDELWEMVEDTASGTIPNQAGFSTGRNAPISYAQNSYQHTGPQQYMVPVTPSTCCICGRPLSNGHAVLFTYQSGDEARIDENCWNMVNALNRYENLSVTMSAVQYAQSRLPYVDSGVAYFLQQRISVAEGFINAPSPSTSQRHRRSSDYDQ